MWWNRQEMDKICVKEASKSVVHSGWGLYTILPLILLLESLNVHYIMQHIPCAKKYVSASVSMGVMRWVALKSAKPVLYAFAGVDWLQRRKNW